MGEDQGRDEIDFEVLVPYIVFKTLAGPRIAIKADLIEAIGECVHKSGRPYTNITLTTNDGGWDVDASFDDVLNALGGGINCGLQCNH